MSKDDEDEKDTAEMKGGPRGKSYKGQKHYPVKTPEDVAEERAAQKEYDKPDAVTIETWFSVSGIRDYTAQQAMRAFTKVKKATIEDWTKIFERF